MVPLEQDLLGLRPAKGDLTLADRVYSCGACRLVPDRDVNAAVNLARHTPGDPKSPPPQAVAA